MYNLTVSVVSITRYQPPLVGNKIQSYVVRKSENFFSYEVRKSRAFSKSSFFNLSCNEVGLPTTYFVIAQFLFQERNACDYKIITWR